jgi:hypothetical protein
MFRNIPEVPSSAVQPLPPAHWGNENKGLPVKAELLLRCTLTLPQVSSLDRDGPSLLSDSEAETGDLRRPRRCGRQGAGAARS